MSECENSASGEDRQQRVTVDMVAVIDDTEAAVKKGTTALFLWC